MHASTGIAKIDNVLNHLLLLWLLLFIKKLSINSLFLEV